MRLRSKSLSSCLGLAVLVGGSVFVASSWDFSGNATAQEAVSGASTADRGANATGTIAPRDVRNQPLAVEVSYDGASSEPRPEAADAAPAPSSRGVDANTASVENEIVMVMVDHAKVVKLPDRTQTVIVGNPMIADITVQRNGVLVVTGKAYGATNLIALDAGGLLLAESMISVQAPTDAVVTVQRGLARESYSCTPTCQPSLRLGDSPEYFGGVGNQTTQRNTLATQR
jgi:Flp pilus assembly secretin CpaC